MCIRDRSSLENPPFLLVPERIESTTIEDVTVSRYSNAEYGFSFMPQTGWMLQGGGVGDEVLIALGLEKDGITPSIILEALESNDTTLKEYFEPRLEMYYELDDDITFDILSEEYITTYAGYVGLEIIALQTFDSSDSIKFKQVMLEGSNFHYVISYANHPDYFDNGLVDYDKIIDSFLITTYIESD